MSYLRSQLLSLRFWWKISTNIVSQPSRNCNRHVIKPLAESVWSALKDVGILRRSRGSHGGRSRAVLGATDEVISTNPGSYETLNKMHKPSEPEPTSLKNQINIQAVASHVASTKSFFVPKIMLSNTMSLVPKVDEVREFLLRNDIDVGFLTETWLKERISDSIVDIPGYNILRKDRSVLEHGGVCAYLKDHIKHSVPENLQCCVNHEILWFKINPKRLPRGTSSIICAVVYHPPGADGPSLVNHLFQSLSTAESLYPNCGLIIAGDFNRLDVNSIRRHFKLKQIVKVPTRGQAILDLVLTNLSDHYSPVEISPPFGLSDHNTIMVKPKVRSPGQSTRRSITVRDTRPSRKNELGRYLCSVDWSVINSTDDCESQLQMFTNLVKNGLDNIMPERSKKVFPLDAPWMTMKLKDLIRRRQLAFHTDRSSLVYKFYRNAVNRERKKCKSQYYSSKVEELKGAKPRLWWREVKKICGSSGKNDSQLMNSLYVPAYENKSQEEIANAINSAFLEPLQGYTQIDAQSTCLPVNEDSEFLVVSSQRVHNCLSQLNIHKAPGPDSLPNWIFKEYADILCTPVADILNSSFRESIVPTVWKQANVVPIPKVKQVKDPTKDLRPISLTPSISKIAEEFVVTDYIKPAVLKSVDNTQYGTIPGSSTVMALISMFHKWLCETDGTGSDVRVLAFDFRKAFDLIDHTILINKLKLLDIPNSLVNWVISFLSKRSQRVMLSQDCMSEWGPVPSGVPQGTKLGPWLFLIMISDLDLPGNLFNVWKYVDDTTVSEIIPRGSSSKVQLAADTVLKWSQENLFQLNCDKCKELAISFKRSQEPPRAGVLIEGKPILNVDKIKLLGVTINNKLTWKDHIEEVVKKAASRLYFLVQLKRSNAPAVDIVAYYHACIRSVMDYACPLFYNALPKYLQDDLERIQKRAMAIVFPSLTYGDALASAGLETIQDHQRTLTMNFFNQIVRDTKSKLHSILPEINENDRYELRKRRKFIVPLAKTKRFSNSFIMAGCKDYNNRL